MLIILTVNLPNFDTWINFRNPSHIKSALKKNNLENQAQYK